MKKLAKENCKVSSWLNKDVNITRNNRLGNALEVMTGQSNGSLRNVLVMECSWVQEEHPLLKIVHEEIDETGGIDVLIEMEIESECDQQEPPVLERMMKRDALVESWRCKRMVRELVHELVEMTPGLAMDNVARMLAAKRAKADGRRRITGLVVGIVCQVPGVSVATAIVKEVLEMAWWRAGVNQAWVTMEGDRRIQRLIEWRMDNQKMDERVVLESIRREERLERAGKLQDALRNQQKVVKDDEMEIDWMIEEAVKMDSD